MRAFARRHQVCFRRGACCPGTLGPPRGGWAGAARRCRREFAGELPSRRAPMLVLTRKVGERLVIGGGITVQVLGVNGRRIRLGVEAPAEVAVRRDELPAIAEE